MVRYKIVLAAFLTLLTLVLSGTGESFSVAIFQTLCYTTTIALIVRSYYEDKVLKTVKIREKYDR